MHAHLVRQTQAACETHRTPPVVHTLESLKFSTVDMISCALFPIQSPASRLALQSKVSRMLLMTVRWPCAQKGGGHQAKPEGAHYPDTGRSVGVPPRLLSVVPFSSLTRWCSCTVRASAAEKQAPAHFPPRLLLAKTACVGLAHSRGRLRGSPAKQMRKGSLPQYMHA